MKYFQTRHKSHIFGVAFAAILGLAACNSLSVVEEQPEALSQSAPPTFADSVNNNKPIGVVKGKFEPLTYPVSKNEALEQPLSKFARDSESYGLIVWHNGEVIFEDYPVPHTSQTLGESASMHKSVMALVLGAAIDDGFIKSVDDPVERYIPEWENETRGKITLRDLLEMNSGLSPLSREGGVGSPAWAFVMEGDKAREMLLDLQPLHQPGEIYEYQNTSSQLLGLVIENAVGKAYHDYLSERIWKAVGASDAKIWLNEDEGFAKTYTGLYATPRDWLRLGLLVKDLGEYKGEQIISSKYIADMTAPSRANPNYGWQIWRNGEYAPIKYYNESKTGLSVAIKAPFLIDDMVYFDGFGGQRVYTSRSEKLVIVRLGNVRMDWDESALPNLVFEMLK